MNLSLISQNHDIPSGFGLKQNFAKCTSYGYGSIFRGVMVLEDIKC